MARVFACSRSEARPCNTDLDEEVRSFRKYCLFTTTKEKKPHPDCLWRLLPKICCFFENLAINCLFFCRQIFIWASNQIQTLLYLLSKVAKGFSGFDIKLWGTQIMSTAQIHSYARVLNTKVCFIILPTPTGWLLDGTWFFKKLWTVLFFV